jgi:ATP-binding cassette subfamily B protein
MTVALLGPKWSSQKNTVSLLLRFYEPSADVIRLKRNHMLPVFPSFVRSRMALLSQEPVLFATAFVENIA